jgi:hypothetical protein
MADPSERLSQSGMRKDGAKGVVEGKMKDGRKEGR